MEIEKEPKIGFKPNLPLDHEHVAVEIERALSNDGWNTVRIAESCRWGRSRLKLHKSRDGRLYVRVGKRGAGKQYIDRCDVTYLDGEPTVHAFKFVKNEWEIKEDERLAQQDADIDAAYPQSRDV